MMTPTRSPGSSAGVATSPFPGEELMRRARFLPLKGGGRTAKATAPAVRVGVEGPYWGADP